MGDSDIREEAELLKMREEVVRGIRFNRQLESDLDLMDLKIGLLVRNRATLQVSGRLQVRSKSLELRVAGGESLIRRCVPANRKWSLTVRN